MTIVIPFWLVIAVLCYFVLALTVLVGLRSILKENREFPPIAKRFIGKRDDRIGVEIRIFILSILWWIFFVDMILDLIKYLRKKKTQM